MAKTYVKNEALSAILRVFGALNGKAVSKCDFDDYVAILREGRKYQKIMNDKAKKITAAGKPRK